jgi:hypothetical protein
VRLKVATDPLPAAEPTNARPHHADLFGEGGLLDLPALESGVQHFLDNLQQPVPDMAEAVTGHGWYPWLAAATVSALACEIARRQLRRTSRTADPMRDAASGTWLPD